MFKAWSKVLLEDILDPSRKITYGILKPDNPCDFPKLMIRTKDYTYGWITHNDVMKVSTALDAEYQRSRVKTGDIVLTVVGNNVGISAVVPKQFDGANISRAVARLAFQDSQSSEFHSQLLKSDWFNNFVYSQQTGGAQPVINLSVLKKLKFPCPPLPEQRKIANILGTWDKAINTTERLIDNSKQQKKALMQQLLIGKKRLLDDSGKPFEGEWEEVTIGSTSKCFSGGTPSRSKEEYYGGDIPWITSGKLNDRFVTSVKEYISELGLKNSSAKVVKNGSLLIAMYGATAGKVAVNKLNGATVNQAVLALEPNKHCHNLFLFYLFEAEMVKALKLVQGGQPNLSAAIIKGIKIKLPSLTEQRKIAVILTNAEKEVELFEQQCAHLKQEKKALMQQLLTGKRRVKVDNTEAA
jgi:type I restriction enzyme S subunit